MIGSYAQKITTESITSDVPRVINKKVEQKTSGKLFDEWGSRVKTSRMRFFIADKTFWNFVRFFHCHCYHFCSFYCYYYYLLRNSLRFTLRWWESYAMSSILDGMKSVWDKRKWKPQFWQIFSSAHDISNN